jgi:hypothetical protein
MMAEEKPPYKLVVDLKAFRVEPLQKALQRLNELTEQHETPGELGAKLTLESWEEEALVEIAEVFEAWLTEEKVGVDGTFTIKRPVVRVKKPEPTRVPAAQQAMAGFRDAVTDFSARYGGPRATISVNGGEPVDLDDTAAATEVIADGLRLGARRRGA